MTVYEIVRKELAKVEGKDALVQFVTIQNFALDQTEKVQMLREGLIDALRWLDAIEKDIGIKTFLEIMPNNCLGRSEMRQRLKFLESPTEKLNRELRESIALEDSDAKG